MPAEIRLIAGLGNPGPDYAATRHNAGYWFVERLALDHGSDFSARARLNCSLARVMIGDRDCRLMKPACYMNQSGSPVRMVSDYFRIPPDQLLVVHDEIDFEPGIVRLKTGGGHGGHNGVRDIIQALGSDAFTRLRIGVGHPGERDKVIGSVLGRPSAADQRLIDQAIDRALESLPRIVAGQPALAMNTLHQSAEKPSGGD